MPSGPGEKIKRYPRSPGQIISPWSGALIRRWVFTTLESDCGSNNSLLPLYAREVNNIITTILNFTRDNARRNVHMHVLYWISPNSVLLWWRWIRRMSRDQHFSLDAIVFFFFYRSPLCPPPPCGANEMLSLRWMTRLCFIKQRYCWSKWSSPGDG